MTGELKDVESLLMPFEPVGMDFFVFYRNVKREVVGTHFIGHRVEAEDGYGPEPKAGAWSNMDAVTRQVIGFLCEGGKECGDASYYEPQRKPRK